MLSSVFTILLIQVIFFFEVSHTYVIYKIVCPHNPAICETPTCYFNVTKGQPQLYHFYIGCKLKKPVPQIQITIMTFLRSGKVYLPFKAVETSLNFCDINAITENKMLKIFIPSIAEQMKTIVSPCPYEKEFKFEGFTVDGSVLPDIMGQKAVKTVVKFSRGKYLPLYSIEFYGNTRTRL